MALVDEMAKLGQGFVNAWDMRTAAVGDIRMDTAAMLSDVHQAHETMAAELRERLASDRALVADEAAALKKTLQAEIVARRRDVAEMQADVTAFLRDLEEAHDAMAAQLRERLADDRAHLAEDGAVLKEQLRTEVDTRRVGVAGMLSDLGGARAAMATEQRDGLTDERMRLAEDVAAARSLLQQDMAEAHAAWQAINETMAARRGGVTEKERHATKPTKLGCDDLTRIHGVGPSMQSHLNDHGIFSFSELGAANADAVRQALGEVGRMAKVEEWIAEARQLAHAG